MLASFIRERHKNQGRKESDREWDAAMRKVGLTPDQIRAIREARFSMVESDEDSGK